MYNIYNYKVWKININTAPEIKKKVFTSPTPILIAQCPVLFF